MFATIAAKIGLGKNYKWGLALGGGGGAGSFEEKQDTCMILSICLELAYCWKERRRKADRGKNHLNQRSKLPSPVTDSWISYISGVISQEGYNNTNVACWLKMRN